MNSAPRLSAVALAALLSCFCLASCAGKKQTPGRLAVVVSIPPQKYFVERVGGARVDASVLIGPGQSPHSYTPTPKQVAGLSDAALYFTVGVPMEETLVAKVREQQRGLKVVDMTRGIAHIKEREHATENGNHLHGEMDPHVWLNPRNAAAMVRTTAAELAALDPAHKREYESNRDALLHDLAALDKSLAKTLAPFRGRRFYVYHPAFGYFGQAYGLEQVAVETGGKEPTARRLEALVSQARAEHVRVIFVQPQFSPKSAERLALEIHGTVIPIDDLAEDYLGNMKRIARALEKGLK